MQLVWRRRRVSVAGERPPRAGQRRAALHTCMGDILKIVRCDAIRIPRGCDGGDFHSVAAIRAGEHETWQMRWGNVRVVHGALPVRVYWSMELALVRLTDETSYAEREC
jgi:hypothetical protein